MGTTPGTFKIYAVGFILSLFFTLLAYFLVIFPLFPSKILVFSITGLALVQAWLQISLCLNLMKENKPRWGLVVFLFMIMVTLILVFGSVWIMDNLNYNLMSP